MGFAQTELNRIKLTSRSLEQSSDVSKTCYWSNAYVGLLEKCQNVCIWEFEAILNFKLNKIAPNFVFVMT